MAVPDSGLQQFGRFYPSGVDAPQDGLRVVVTGGAGFVGANLCRRLVRTEGIAEVAVVDDLSTGRLSNLEGVPVRFVEASILDPAVLDELFDGVHTVVHLAARGSVPRSLADPVATHAANATGTVSVLEAARRAGVAHLVYSSSSSVYGAQPQLPKSEELAPRPMSPYAASKLAAESYVLAYGHSYGLSTLALRFFNVYGPLQSSGHDYAAVIPAFVDSSLRGGTLRVHGDGRQTRDFTYVGTVVDTVTAAVVAGRSHPDPVNLAFGTRTSLVELIATLEEVLGRRLEVEHDEARVGDVRDSQADGSALVALFPELRPTGLREGLEETVAWFRSWIDRD